MKVTRHCEGSYVVKLSHLEEVQIYKMAERDDKTVEEFLLWLLSVGVQIFKLTIK